MKAKFASLKKRLRDRWIAWKDKNWDVKYEEFDSPYVFGALPVVPKFRQRAITLKNFFNGHGASFIAGALAGTFSTIIGGLILYWLIGK